MRGPHFTNLDSSLLKNFNFTESMRLQFRAEAFNTTNTPPFAQPGQLNFTSRRLQQHHCHEEQQRELRSPHAAARAQAVLLVANCRTSLPHPAQRICAGCGFLWVEFLMASSK